MPSEANRAPTGTMPIQLLVLMVLYGVLMAVSIVLVVRRRHIQPIKFRDPLLLVSPVVAQFLYGVLSALPPTSNPFLDVLQSFPFLVFIVLMIARFWKLFLASYITNARLNNDSSAWILRHSNLASSRHIWRGSITIIVALALAQLVLSLNDSEGFWGLNIFYFNTVLLTAWCLLTVLLVWKLRGIRDGFFVVAELKMLGAVVIGVNLFIIIWMANGTMDTSIQMIIILSYMAHIAIQLLYPLWKSYEMERTDSRTTETPKLTGLLAVIQHPSGFVAFKQFLTLEFSVENLFCWKVLHDGTAVRDPDKITALFQHVYDNFVRPGSPNEVNIDWELQSVVKMTLQSDHVVMVNSAGDKSNTDPNLVKINLMRNLHDDIVRLMEDDSFRRFKQTAQYRSLL